MLSTIIDKLVSCVAYNRPVADAGYRLGPDGRRDRGCERSRHGDVCSEARQLFGGRSRHQKGSGKSDYALVWSSNELVMNTFGDRYWR